MAYVNTAPPAELESTYNALVKYVKQYITGGNLKSKFDVFEREEVAMGGGIESNIILAATNLRAETQDGTIPNRAAEHGTYTPKVFTLISTKHKPYQYGVTINEDRLALCVNNEEALRKYAAELTESLYQAWVNEKNAGVAAAIDEIVDFTAVAPITIEIGDGTQQYADALVTAAKAAVEDMREGVTGNSYGNTEIGTSRIAADTVVMVMSNSLAAMLDTYGYSKAFNENYLKLSNVARVTSLRVPENTILITDSRNIILHKRRENIVRLQNSDGSYNLFHNVDYFLDVADNKDSKEESAAEIIGYPFKVIKGVETPATVATQSETAKEETEETAKE